MSATSTTTAAARRVRFLRSPENKARWSPLAALMLTGDALASYMSVDDRRAWFATLNAALAALELDGEQAEQESFESPALELAMASAVISARGFQD